MSIYSPVLVTGFHFDKPDDFLLEHAQPGIRIGMELLPTSFHTYPLEQKQRLCDYLETGTFGSGRLRDLLGYQVYGLSPVDRSGDLVKDYKAVVAWRKKFDPRKEEDIARYEEALVNSIRSFWLDLIHVGKKHTRIAQGINASVIAVS